MPRSKAPPTKRASAAGLHSPVMTRGGFPVVDGLITSFDKIKMVTLAKYGLAPLLAACKATGTCDKTRELLLREQLAYVRPEDGGF